MRNMSFALTTEQIKNESKTVTRQFGWLTLKVGDRLRPVLKCMGIRKGEKQERLLIDGRCIEVVKVGEEPLSIMSQEDCIKEGFPDMTPQQFTDMIIKHYGSKINKFSRMTRIEFKYIDED